MPTAVAAGHVSRFEAHQILRTELNQSSVRKPTASPRPPRRNTEQRGWYKNWCDEMGMPRSSSVHFRFSSNQDLRDRSASSERTTMRSLSRSPSRCRSVSPTPRHREQTPIPMKHDQSVASSSCSVKTEASKNQEFYSFRDARQGKPLPGDNGYRVWGNRNRRREPSGGLPRGQNLWGSCEPLPRSPSPPPMRRAKSVPPPPPIHLHPQPEPCLKLEQSKSLGSSLDNIRRIDVTTVPVPVPPRPGTIANTRDWYHQNHLPMVHEEMICTLCQKNIGHGERHLNHDGKNFHSYHFGCSYCGRTLKNDDFIVAADHNPYCSTCEKHNLKAI